jgi:hypothetical protein
MSTPSVSIRIEVEGRQVPRCFDGWLRHPPVAHGLPEKVKIGLELRRLTDFLIGTPARQRSRDQPIRCGINVSLPRQFDGLRGCVHRRCTMGARSRVLPLEENSFINLFNMNQEEDRQPLSIARRN